jgi:DNA-binding LytR/AlgR family response regulator
MRCLIVDDEPLAREGLALYAQELPWLQVVGSYPSAPAAQAALQEQAIDLVFLDINLPKLTGLQWLETLTHPPLVILATAYPNYALEAFRLQVVDYLLKPIALARFVQAVTKAREYFLLQKAAAEPVLPTAEYIFVKHALRYEKIALTDILYVEGLQNYVVLHTTAGKRVLHLTLKAVMQTLTAPQFLRIHKSYLINTQHLLAVEGHVVHIGQVVLPISRAQREDLLQQVVYDKLLWKK